MSRIIFLLICLLSSAIPSHAVENESISLFSYSGYLTTPSAYITDGSWGFHYTYLPEGFAPFHKEKSDNWVFSTAIGFLPFVEVYFSVFVSPSINVNYSIPNYGADKTRSPGFKIQLVGERNLFPALAVGIFDPPIGKASHNNIPSLFLVSSKRLLHDRLSVSLGYGADAFDEQFERLKGMWGGCGLRVNRYLDLLADYDGEVSSAGLSAYTRGFQASFDAIPGKGLAFRFGYVWNLLK